MQEISPLPTKNAGIEDMTLKLKMDNGQLMIFKSILIYLLPQDVFRYFSL